ncbi:MAG: hypothetical protein M1826_002420 [Phylliscum demangeonii]|nr:MAG: hypothetical protein M1826_002420 [Phylliscum demangeonii]
MAGRMLPYRRWLAAPSQHHIRAFSSSPSRRIHGRLPTFAATSSPELDAHFAAFREKVFLPAHLPRQQRALVYRQKYRAMLEAEPFYVELGPEKVQLRPIDRLKDEVPGTLKTMQRMLELMTVKHDFDNLPDFLAELCIANRSLPAMQLTRIVRRANLIGAEYVVLECAKRGAATGLTLADVPLAREVMWGAHTRGQRRAWADPDECRKALVHAESIMRLLEAEEHSGWKELGAPDPRLQPDLVGVLLETAAIYVFCHCDGRDADHKVRDYAERLMAVWPHAVSYDADHPPPPPTPMPPRKKKADAATATAAANATAANATAANATAADATAATAATEVDATEVDATPKANAKLHVPEAWHVADIELQRWAPVWAGMQFALRVLDPQTPVARWIQSTLPSLDEVLRAAEALVEQSASETRPRKGLSWYQALRKVLPPPPES